ncbi:MAG: class I SAM-dependent methyltransferase [Dehalococcoidia bacterium]
MNLQTAGLPGVDLHYDLEDDIPPPPYRRDTRFVFARLARAVLNEVVAGGPGRVLDVGCGYGIQLRRLYARGCEPWGLDASAALLRYCRRQAAEHGASLVLVHGVAERLPFRTASFDRVICQGSLDHFAQPRAFMSEVARILKPEGRAIIALANFDSLSCIVARCLYRAKEALNLPLRRDHRPFWQVPDNHTFKGNLRVLEGLGRPWLELERCYGISLLWLLTRWSLFVEGLPEDTARGLLRTADRIAYRLPKAADMIVSVWRPRAKSWY